MIKNFKMTTFSKQFPVQIVTYLFSAYSALFNQFKIVKSIFNLCRSFKFIQPQKPQLPTVI